MLKKKIHPPDIPVRYLPGSSADIRGREGAGNKFHIFCAPAQAFTLRFITGGVQSPGTEPVRPEAKAYIAIDPCEEIHGPGAVGEYVLFGQIGYGGLIQEISFFTPGQQRSEEHTSELQSLMRS